MGLHRPPAPGAWGQLSTVFRTRLSFLWVSEQRQSLPSHRPKERWEELSMVLTWDEGGPPARPRGVFSNPELATSRQWGLCNLAFGKPHSVPVRCVTDEVDPNEPLQRRSALQQ